MHRTAEILHAWDEAYAGLGLMAALCLDDSGLPAQEFVSECPIFTNWERSAKFRSGDKTGKKQERETGGNASLPAYFKNLTS